MYKDYFHITQEEIDLSENALYPFHLYIFNRFSKEYHLYLQANAPLTMEKKTFLHDLIEKGAILSILKNQEKTYLYSQGRKKEDILGLKDNPLQGLVNKQERLTRELENKKEENIKNKKDESFKTLFNKAILNDDFTPLILKTRDEIMTFRFTISHTVSLANYLAEQLLTCDNIQNRITTLSYQMAKAMGIDDTQSLGDIVCASFIAHIGNTQFDYRLSRKSHLEQTIKEQGQCKKHLGLAQHLIRKSGVLISERCNQIMYQHHERVDGSGYPEYKKGEFMDPLGVLLSATTHIVEYSSGLITGKKYPLKEIINCFKTKNPLPHLNIQYDAMVEDLMANILDERPHDDNLVDDVTNVTAA